MPKKHIIFIILNCIFILVLSIHTPLAAGQCTDNDNDGYAVEGGICGTPDCDDQDNRVFPGAPKICDGKDSNCDGKRDYPTDKDEDGDGVPWCGGDCDDNNPLVHVGADDNNCDNIDNNCSGSPDDGYVPALSNCGQGACSSTGRVECQGGKIVDTCTAGSPDIDDSSCNGIDDDCDGATDEDFAITVTSCGVGACEGNTGQLECQNGTEVDTCDAMAGAADDTECNGIDDDCDGSTDEDFAITATSCGIGACEGNTGQLECQNGTEVDTCDAMAGAVADDTECNGIDDDCDGATDEDYVVTATSCGTGICATTGLSECRDGTEMNTCNTETSQIEGPFGDPSCSDGIDNDCDQQTDHLDAECASTCLDYDGDGFIDLRDPACSTPHSAIQLENNALAIYKTGIPIFIDGDLSETAWIDAFSVSLTNASGVEHQVKVKALWDDEAIYLAYEVNDSDLIASVINPDGVIWNEDSVEWGIDTHNNGGSIADPDSHYMLPDDYHGIINILNTHYDEQGTVSGLPSISWNGTWESAVLVNGTINDNLESDIGYTVEVKIPWSEIGYSSAPDEDIIVRMGFLINDKNTSSIDYTMWTSDEGSSFANSANWQEVIISSSTLFSYYCDDDSDGHFNLFRDGICPGAGCEPAGCLLMPGDDCDDNDAQVYPGSPEICDAKDSNCDWLVPVSEMDVDGDGFSDCSGDCDDNDAQIFPTSLGICDELTGNCVDHVTLSWMPSSINADGTVLTDLAGYNLYFGASTDYSDLMELGNLTCHSFTNLTPGPWCFAVTAYDTTGNESSFSNEVCKFIN
jgi:hypothetical protein